MSMMAGGPETGGAVQKTDRPPDPEEIESLLLELESLTDRIAEAGRLSVDRMLAIERRLAKLGWSVFVPLKEGVSEIGFDGHRFLIRMVAPAGMVLPSGHDRNPVHLVDAQHPTRSMVHMAYCVLPRLLTTLRDDLLKEIETWGVPDRAQRGKGE